MPSVSAVTWFNRFTWASVGFIASTLIAHAKPEYAAHPDWHISMGGIAVTLMVLLAVVGEATSGTRR